MKFNWFKKKEKAQQAPGGESPDAQHEPQEPSEATWEEDQPDESLAAQEADTSPAPVEQEPAGTPPSPPPGKSTGFLSRLKRGLAKTREILTTDIDKLFSGKSRIDDDLLEELEELLITSDIGVQTAMELMSAIRHKASKIEGPDELKAVLKQQIVALFDNSLAQDADRIARKPHVVMVVGVNGVGKTTTIGKLAARAASQGHTVLIAAADTFRAAATEQLAIWAQRAGADFVRHKDNADPAAVAFDGIEAAVARGSDVVFIDTAGRLHTKVNLMEELKKIKRTIGRQITDAPHEVLLVLDATTGQNALSQAKLFHEAIGVTGLALTKLDGTAKGGIVISICRSLNIPLHYIGVGESIEDLQPFDPHRFVDAMF
jgi:fused signal recognition particle receptor